MKKIDIFIDLENIGMSKRPSREVRNIKAIGERLGRALARIGHRPQKVMAFASFGVSSLRRYRTLLRKEFKGDMTVSQATQDKISEACSELGWTMVWHRGIADRTLEITVGRHLRDNTLESDVMLMTNDEDFVELVEKIKASGRKVIICGQSISKKLVEVADQTLHLWKFLSPPCADGQGPFNPIPLP